jgi:hypothetical protein
MTCRRCAVSLALAMLAAHSLAAQPDGAAPPQLPVTAPPQFAMVSELNQDQGYLAIQYSTTVSVIEMVSVERVVDGKVVSEQVPRTESRVEVRTHQAPLDDLRFFGVDGLKVPAAGALARLRPGLMVLRMDGNAPPAAEFRQVLAKDVLIVTRRDPPPVRPR